MNQLVAGIASAAIGVFVLLAPAANAEGTVLLSDIEDITSLPICQLEDCSDQPGQVGLWEDTDTGDWYLSRSASEYYVILDDFAV